MSVEKNENTSARQKRVKRLKRLIIATLLTLIAIPIICSVILLVQVASLNRRVDDMARKLMELEWSERLQASLPSQNGEQFPAMHQVASGVTDEQFAHRVYLTFDDGPSAYTNEILDILAEYDIKATFFVVGKEDDKSKEALKRIVAEGHTLGMHSYSHKYADLYSSEESFENDFLELKNYLEETTGVPCKFYRFPGGSSNTVSKVDMQVLTSYLEKQGISYFDWNISSGDASRNKLSVDTLVKNCTQDIGRYNDAVILLHDSADKKSTVDALPQIIETILDMEDTVILPITETTQPIRHLY